MSTPPSEQARPNAAIIMMTVLTRLPVRRDRIASMSLHDSRGEGPRDWTHELVAKIRVEQARLVSIPALVRDSRS